MYFKLKCRSGGVSCLCPVHFYNKNRVLGLSCCCPLWESIRGPRPWKPPLVKQHLGAVRTPVKVPVATHTPGCEYGPQWHWPSEAVYRGPTSLRSVSFHHLTSGAPPTFFPKTCFNRRLQILPQSSPQDRHAQILLLMGLC